MKKGSIALDAFQLSELEKFITDTGKGSDKVFVLSDIVLKNGRIHMLGWAGEEADKVQDIMVTAYRQARTVGENP